MTLEAQYDAKIKELSKEGVWDNLLYSNDEFSVIAPTCHMDLHRESRVLHHLAVSYEPRVVNRETNILFIRKNNDLDTPFYTIEVKNGVLKQCCGFGNASRNEATGLTEFLQEYCRSKYLEYM